MTWFLLIAMVGADVPTTAPPETPNTKAIAQAIDAGRLDQARLMIGKAVVAGAKGSEIDGLAANLAFAEGKDAEALARYERLIADGDNSAAIAEHAGIAALRLGDIQKALPLIERATRPQNASWRAWNARGVIADRQGDWATADTAYRKAADLASDRPEILNNRGWSQLLRGNWAGAVDYFGRAVSAGSNSPRIRNNLELARAALASELPNRRPRESDSEWAARLNDAGVAARIMGDSKRAIAAFTQALEASGNWYARAANNLEAATASR